jgi:hypothetical protein
MDAQAVSRRLDEICPGKTPLVKPPGGNRLTPYTQQMADAMDELLAGVTVDEDE